MFRLLLQLAQLEQASEAQAGEAQQAAGAAQQQLAACQGQLSLLQQQSVALHIDIDMLRLSTQRAEEATAAAHRQATATAALGCMQQSPWGGCTTSISAPLTKQACMWNWATCDNETHALCCSEVAELQQVVAAQHKSLLGVQEAILQANCSHIEGLAAVARQSARIQDLCQRSALMMHSTDVAQRHL